MVPTRQRPIGTAGGAHRESRRHRTVDVAPAGRRRGRRRGWLRERWPRGATSTGLRSRPLRPCGGAATRCSPRSPSRRTCRRTSSACTPFCSTPRCTRSRWPPPIINWRCRSHGSRCRCTPRARRRCGRRSTPTGANSVSIELADGLGLAGAVGGFADHPAGHRRAARHRDPRSRLAASSSRSNGRRCPRRRSPHRRPPTSSSSNPSRWQSIPPSWPPGCIPPPTGRWPAVQSWLAEPSGVLVVLTRGAVALPGEDVTDLAGAAVWGLVRVRSDRAPRSHRARRRRGRRSTPRRCWRVGEPQLVVRDGAFHAPRVVRSRGSGLDSGATGFGQAVAARRDHRGHVRQPGARRGSELRRSRCRPAHIRVELHAVAANFRDVMITLGMFTHDALIGSEAAGVVTEVGRGRHRLRRRPARDGTVPRGHRHAWSPPTPG